jgi:hypothetical protein
MAREWVMRLGSVKDANGPPVPWGPDWMVQAPSILRVPRGGRGYPPRHQGRRAAELDGESSVAHRLAPGRRRPSRSQRARRITAGRRVIKPRPSAGGTDRGRAHFCSVSVRSAAFTPHGSWSPPSCSALRFYRPSRTRQGCRRRMSWRVLVFVPLMRGQPQGNIEART